MDKNNDNDNTSAMTHDLFLKRFINFVQRGFALILAKTESSCSFVILKKVYNMDDYCLVVEMSDVKEVRQCLKDLGLSDPTRRLKSNTEENTIAVPINVAKLQKQFSENTDADFRKSLHEYISKLMPGQVRSVEKMCLPQAKKLSIKKPETLMKERLQILLTEKGHTWNKDIEKDIPTHWERHGDLVLLPGSGFMNPIWKELGHELWECVVSCMSCKRVARKDVISTNGYRSPQVSMLFGENSWVLHTDNGIKYTYDITKCMFSSGNITEKLRVATFDCTNETVVDLYAGIGYFTLPYLVFTNVKHLHACEWNPDAAEALRKNLVLNRVQSRCTIHEGDNRKNCPKGIADRVNLGLIPSCKDGWPVACEALNPETGGILHIHYNVNTHPSSGTSTLCPTGLPTEAFRQEAKIGSDEISHPQELNHHCSSDTSNLQLVTSCRYDVLDEHKRKSEWVNVSGGLVVSSHTDNHEKRAEESEISKMYPCERSKGDNCDMNDAEKADFSRDSSGGCMGNVLSSQPMCKNECDIIQNSETCDADTPHAETRAGRDATVQHEKDTEKFNVDLKSQVDINGHQISHNNIRSCYSNHPNINTVKESKYAKWLPWAHGISMEIKNILHLTHKTEWQTHILHIEHVKSYAPHVDHVVLDLECRPVNK